MASAQAAANTLCNPDTEVSAHYLITEDGEVISLVPEAMRAWHAGAGAWGYVRDVNSRSIGVELANTGFTPFAAEGDEEGEREEEERVAATIATPPGNLRRRRKAKKSTESEIVSMKKLLLTLWIKKTIFSKSKKTIFSRSKKTISSKSEKKIT